MSSRILPKFELFMPESIQAVVDCLQKYKDKAAVMAGGTDLMVRMKSGIAPEVVVSLARVKGLDDLSYDDQDGLTIGATTTINQVLAFDNIQTLYPALFASAKENGTVQTRQVATVLGNLLNASPAADCACAVLALGGHVLLQGPEGTRKVAIDEFWTGYRQTARKPDELALKLVIYPPGKSGSAFRALTRTQKICPKSMLLLPLPWRTGSVSKPAWPWSGGTHPDPAEKMRSPDGGQSPG